MKSVFKSQGYFEKKIFFLQLIKKKYKKILLNLQIYLDKKLTETGKKKIT